MIEFTFNIRKPSGATESLTFEALSTSEVLEHVKQAYPGAEVSWVLPDFKNLYERAYAQAVALMEISDADGVQLEPRSALKGAADNVGIPFGIDMERFVEWAEARMFGDQDTPRPRG